MDLGQLAGQHGRHLVAGQLRHPQVQQGDVRTFGPGQLDRLLAVGCGADHLDRAGGRQQQHQPVTHHGLVVGDEDPDHADTCAGTRMRTCQPPDGRGPAVTEPPTAASRSDMPASPSPEPWPGTGSRPGGNPSSSTQIVTPVSVWSTATVTGRTGGVAGGVGQGLLHRAVGGVPRGGRHLARFTDDVQGDAAGVALDERRQVGDAQPERVAQRAHHRPGLAQPVAGQCGGAVERFEHCRTDALPRCHGSGRLQLDGQAGEAVRQHVVQLARDPAAFLQRGCLRLGVAAGLHLEQERLCLVARGDQLAALGRALGEQRDAEPGQAADQAVRHVADHAADRHRGHRDERASGPGVDRERDAAGHHERRYLTEPARGDQHGGEAGDGGDDDGRRGPGNGVHVVGELRGHRRDGHQRAGPDPLLRAVCCERGRQRDRRPAGDTPDQRTLQGRHPSSPSSTIVAAEMRCNGNETRPSRPG